MGGGWAGAAALACALPLVAGAKDRPKEAPGRARQSAVFTATATILPMVQVSWETDEESGETRVYWATNARGEVPPPVVTLERAGGAQELLALGEPGTWQTVVPARPKELLAKRERSPTRRRAAAPAR